MIYYFEFPHYLVVNVCRQPPCQCATACHSMADTDNEHRCSANRDAKPASNTSGALDGANATRKVPQGVCC